MESYGRTVEHIANKQTMILKKENKKINGDWRAMVEVNERSLPLAAGERPSLDGGRF